MRALVISLVLTLGCAGAADGGLETVVDGGGSADAGPAATPPDAGCGLSFDDAAAAFAPERVCQTTVYDLVTGYCTHWVACSSLY